MAAWRGLRRPVWSRPYQQTTDVIRIGSLRSAVIYFVNASQPRLASPPSGWHESRVDKVKRRFASLLFGLNRASTRERYRSEFEELLDELIGSGDVSWHVWLDIAFAASRDRLCGFRRSRLISAGTVLLVTASVLATWAFVDPRSTSPTSTTVAAAHPLLGGIDGSIPRPIDVPTGPQVSAASCPNPPQLSSPLPAGASISAPSLVPPNTASLTGAGQTYDLTGTCEYTLTFRQG